jgi:hypothetical protein
MRNCNWDCDFLIFDVTMLFLRFIADTFLRKRLNTNFNFLFRCYIGFTFDSIEYGILSATAHNIDYERFEVIFIVMGIFTGIVTLLCCFNHNIYIFLAVLVFKGISLTMALFIFTTMGSDWDSIERMFKDMDSAGDFFLAVVTFISFVDVCVIIGNLGFKVLATVCCSALNKGRCRRFVCRNDEDVCATRVFSNRVGSSY